MTTVESYIVTGKNAPDWLRAGADKGIIKFINDEDGNFDKIIVESPTGRKFAKEGDVIVKTRSGFSVVTGEQAKKYKMTFVPRPKKPDTLEKESEEKEDEVKK